MIGEAYELLGTSEIVALLGVPAQCCREVITGRAFPEPVAHLAHGPVWLRADVIAAVPELPVQAAAYLAT
jgi:hypothetical protein